MSDKACKNCHYLTSKNVCPVCKSQAFAERWKGFVQIANPGKSKVAKTLGISVPGRYALKLG